MSLKEQYSMQDGFIPPSSLIPGQRYQAYDIMNMDAEPELLTVEGVMPSENDPAHYTLSVMLEVDGRMEMDLWQVGSDQRIFKNYTPPPLMVAEKKVVEIKPTVKILGVSKINEGDTHEYHVSLKPVPRRMQIGDAVIYEKKKGFITGAHGDDWIVQCQFQTFWAKTNQLTSLEEKTKVVGYDQFKFDKKTQELLFEQMVKCGIFMNNVPVKVSGCYVNYADWKHAKDDDHIQIMVENQAALYEKSIIRIIEDVNSFANPANYIEGVIIDVNTAEAMENLMLNVEDYTMGSDDENAPVRVLRVDDQGNQFTDTLAKATLNTLSV